MTPTYGPAFQFYSGDWLGSERVSMMPFEEEGVYIRLLAYCWRTGSIPSDPQKIAFLLGKGASTTLAATVATMFQPDPNDSTRLIHDRLDAEREKQRLWREKSSKGGKKSADERKKKKARVVQPPLVPPKAPKGQPNGNTSSSSSFASSSSISSPESSSKKDQNPPEQSPKRKSNKPNPPKNLEEVVQYAKDRRSCLNPTTFWEYFEASEPKWHDKGGDPVRAWKQKFITWEGREKATQAKQKGIYGTPVRLN